MREVINSAAVQYLVQRVPYRSAWPWRGRGLPGEQGLRAGEGAVNNKHVFSSRLGPGDSEKGTKVFAKLDTAVCLAGGAIIAAGLSGAWPLTVTCSMEASVWVSCFLIHVYGSRK